MPSSATGNAWQKREPSAASDVPLTKKRALLNYERQLRLWLAAAGVAFLVPIGALLRIGTGSTAEWLGLLCLLLLAYLLLADTMLQHLIRPLQTLTNIVAAIREGDYSFRARGGRRGDSVGDLAFEINALSGALQEQRTAAQDALSLLERVLTSMHSPVLAFDETDRLRLLNVAAREAFSVEARDAIGRRAAELHLADLLTLQDQDVFPPVEAGYTAVSFTETGPRWSVRRGAFRLKGVPHTLLVFSDISAVLREEERLAWRRLIRVLSHEINNSLTPIQSIAGSLRSLSISRAASEDGDLVRGLSIIEKRAASLNSFLQAYQKLTHLPSPSMQLHRISEVVMRPALLETRLPVSVLAGPDVSVTCDSDQVEQALINLLRNAVDAALAPEAQLPGRNPQVQLTWTVSATEARIAIEDDGLGIINPSNLFVPFYTTKPQGSGIGLVLARQIAAAHHGSVTLESRGAQRGCTAVLTLPLEPLQRPYPERERP